MKFYNKKTKISLRWIKGIIIKLRGYFFTGLLFTAPIALTIYLTCMFINFIDNKIQPIIPETYYPEYYLKIPGMGLIIGVIFLTIIGSLMAGVFGRYLIKLSEHLLKKMPGVSSLYSTIKQIFQTLFNNKSTAFREVVMVEYPRKGIWSLGFITGITKGEVQDVTKNKVVNVFIPTTPNPTSGYLLFVSSKDIYPLNMTVEEGIKMVVSAGLVTPNKYKK